MNMKKSTEKSIWKKISDVPGFGRFFRSSMLEYSHSLSNASALHIPAVMWLPIPQSLLPQPLRLGPFLTAAKLQMGENAFQRLLKTGQEVRKTTVFQSKYGGFMAS